MNKKTETGLLLLKEGQRFQGTAFGFPKSAAGEVVFNTGMVGYPEALSDPSYRGQILVLTYPLIGNYGVPADHGSGSLSDSFESDKIQISGLIVSQASLDHSHWDASKGLQEWLYEHEIPAISGIDTRAVTKCLREKGSTLGKILLDGRDIEFQDPNIKNLVSEVSVERPVVYSAGKKRILLIDCGCKNNILRSLLSRNLSVVKVPWDYDFLNEKYDGIVISNGPGDPKMCSVTIAHVRRAMEEGRPILGICLGHQILALAAGADTYKLKFGHRSQNQPCTEVGTKRCYITSQNHGYAVSHERLPVDWSPWFVNANDGTNEGIRHQSKPFMSVQFHPEASPGPVDTHFLFDEFLKVL